MSALLVGVAFGGFVSLPRNITRGVSGFLFSTRLFWYKAVWLNPGGRPHGVAPLPLHNQMGCVFHRLGGRNPLSLRQHVGRNRVSSANRGAAPLLYMGGKCLLPILRIRAALFSPSSRRMFKTKLARWNKGALGHGNNLCEILAPWGTPNILLKIGSSENSERFSKGLSLGDPKARNSLRKRLFFREALILDQPFLPKLSR